MVFRFRAVAWAEAETTIVGLKMDRHVMNLDADAPTSKLVEDLTPWPAFLAQANDVEVKGAAVFGQNGRHLQRQITQESVIRTRQLVAALDNLVDASCLTETESRLHVGHSVVEAQELLLVVPRTVGRLDE